MNPFRRSRCASGRVRRGRAIASIQGAGGIEALECRSLLSFGAPDPSFGDGGTSDVAIDRPAPVAVGVQPDGGVLVAGSQQKAFDGDDFTVLRLAPDGRPDPAFGSGGRVTTDITGGLDGARAMAVMGDGRFVLAGGGNAPDLTISSRFAVARYLPDGRPDRPSPTTARS